jgi:hypothetical protein
MSLCVLRVHWGERHWLTRIAKPLARVRKTLGRTSSATFLTLLISALADLDRVKMSKEHTQDWGEGKLRGSVGGAYSTDDRSAARLLVKPPLRDRLTSHRSEIVIPLLMLALGAAGWGIGYLLNLTGLR